MRSRPEPPPYVRDDWSFPTHEAGVEDSADGRDVSALPEAETRRCGRQQVASSSAAPPAPTSAAMASPTHPVTLNPAAWSSDQSPAPRAPIAHDTRVIISTYS